MGAVWETAAASLAYSGYGGALAKLLIHAIETYPHDNQTERGVSTATQSADSASGKLPTDSDLPPMTTSDLAARSSHRGDRVGSVIRSASGSVSFGGLVPDGAARGRLAETRPSLPVG